MHNIPLHNSHLAQVAPTTTTLSLLELLSMPRPKVFLLRLRGRVLIVVLVSRLFLSAVCLLL